jgi:hypothetical protein
MTGLVVQIRGTAIVADAFATMTLTGSIPATLVMLAGRPLLGLAGRFQRVAARKAYRPECRCPARAEVESHLNAWPE